MAVEQKHFDLWKFFADKLAHYDVALAAFFYKAFRLCEDNYVFGAAVFYCRLYRYRAGKAAVVVKLTVQFGRRKKSRNRAGSTEVLEVGAVFKSVFTFKFSCSCVGNAYFKLSFVFVKSVVIKRNEFIRDLSENKVKPEAAFAGAEIYCTDIAFVAAVFIHDLAVSCELF